MLTVLFDFIVRAQLCVLSWMCWVRTAVAAEGWILDETVGLKIQNAKLCICLHLGGSAVLSWIIETPQSQRLFPIFVPCTLWNPLCGKSADSCQTFSHILNCTISGVGWCFLDKNKGEPCCHISALFFLEVQEWTRGWAYPRTGPTVPEQPACLGAKTVQITCVKGWREAELQRESVMCIGEAPAGLLSVKLRWDTTEVNEKVCTHYLQIKMCTYCYARHKQYSTKGYNHTHCYLLLK